MNTLYLPRLFARGIVSLTASSLRLLAEHGLGRIIENQFVLRSRHTLHMVLMFLMQENRFGRLIIPYIQVGALGLESEPLIARS